MTKNNKFSSSDAKNINQLPSNTKKSPLVLKEDNDLNNNNNAALHTNTAPQLENDIAIKTPARPRRLPPIRTKPIELIEDIDEERTTLSKDSSVHSLESFSSVSMSDLSSDSLLEGESLASKDKLSPKSSKKKPLPDLSLSSVSMSDLSSDSLLEGESLASKDKLSPKSSKKNKQPSLDSSFSSVSISDLSSDSLLEGEPLPNPYSEALTSGSSYASTEISDLEDSLSLESLDTKRKSYSNNSKSTDSESEDKSRLKSSRINKHQPPDPSFSSIGSDSSGKKSENMQPAKSQKPHRKSTSEVTVGHRNKVAGIPSEVSDKSSKEEVLKRADGYRAIAESRALRSELSVKERKKSSDAAKVTNPEKQTIPSLPKTEALPFEFEKEQIKLPSDLISYMQSERPRTTLRPSSANPIKSRNATLNIL